MPNTREKMIKLAEVIDSYFGCDAAYFDVDKFTLAKRIMEAGWTKQEWISVNDRLPIVNVGVLVYAPRLKNIFEVFYKGDGKWEIVSYRGGEILNDEVTHWMPLPQPPKGE